MQFKTLSQTQLGELSIFSQNILSAIFPIIILLSLRKTPSLVSLAFSSLVAGVLFAFVLTQKRLWKEFLNVRFLKFGAITGFLLGVVFHSLYYSALNFTTPGNISLVGLVEIATSFCLFHILKKEYISKEHMWGIVLMCLGGLVVLFPKAGALNKGDLIMLLAVCVSPFGNYFQKKAREEASVFSILFLRSLITFPAALILAKVFGQNYSLLDLKVSFWFLLVNGVFMLGLTKVLWVEGIHRISVTKANALGAVGPLFTLFFAFLILGQIPFWWQLLAFVPMAFGLRLLTREQE